MRIITWNIHRAKADNAVWEVILRLRPDIALLQEVGVIPQKIGNSFSVLSRRAIYKNGKPQRFSTSVLVSGNIVGEFELASECEWVNRELDFFRGNLIGCTVQPNNGQVFKVVSVYSPAWPVDRERLSLIDVTKVKTKTNPDVWAADILWAALKPAISKDETWVVGGDFNSSETFDADWQDRNETVYGIRSSGNAEMLERMDRMGLCECLRKYNNGRIIPTFRHSSGAVKHQIDHLFVSEGYYPRLEACIPGDAAVIFGQSLSDHLPIVADFRDDG
jgi:exonuclease III